MKATKTFRQYIWIINTLRAYKGLTFEELSQKWATDAIADGNPLQRSSFNRHRDAILSMFGIIIECDKKTYKYYISNKDSLSDGSIERWLFSTLTVHGVLSDSAAVKERVVLEDVPEEGIKKDTSSFIRDSEQMLYTPLLLLSHRPEISHRASFHLGSLVPT